MIIEDDLISGRIALTDVDMEKLEKWYKEFSIYLGVNEVKNE